MELVNAIVELYKKVATELPEDVVEALKKAKGLESKETLAFHALSTILKNVELAKKECEPICQDTGTPIFFVKNGRNFSQSQIKEAIIEATRKATREIPLRPNAVDPLTGKNTGDNVGDDVPVIYFEQWESDRILIQLLLKGGGCENIGRLYKLPEEELGAQRDLDGVRKCAIDAVFRAQGEGCPPAIVGIGIGGTRATACKLSTQQLLRKLTDKNQLPALEKLENELVAQLNSMGIGPLGLGGKTTVLGVKAGAMARHPASFFVDISFLCWAARRGSLEFKNGRIRWSK